MRPSLHRPGEVSAGTAASVVVLDPSRGDADGADPLQGVVPLVWGLAIDDEVWNHAVLSKNQDQTLESDVVEAFFAELMKLADKAGLCSREQFSVDSTMIRTWVSPKRFKPRVQACSSGHQQLGESPKASSLSA